MPASFELAATTSPYYRSTYVFVVETWRIGGRLRGVRVSEDGRTVYIP